MEREKFSIYRKWVDVLKQLNDKARLDAYDAIANYALDGVLSDNPMLQLFMDTIDKEAAISAVRSKSGKKGGAPAGNKNAVKNKQKQAKNKQKTSKNKQSCFDDLENEDKNLQNKELVDENLLVSSRDARVINSLSLLLNNNINENNKEREKEKERERYTDANWLEIDPLFEELDRQEMWKEQFSMVAVKRYPAFSMHDYLVFVKEQSILKGYTGLNLADAKNFCANLLRYYTEDKTSQKARKTARGRESISDKNFDEEW